MYLYWAQAMTSVSRANYLVVSWVSLTRFCKTASLQQTARVIFIFIEYYSNFNLLRFPGSLLALFLYIWSSVRPINGNGEEEAYGCRADRWGKNHSWKYETSAFQDDRQGEMQRWKNILHESWHCTRKKPPFFLRDEIGVESLCCSNRGLSANY